MTKEELADAYYRVSEWFETAAYADVWGVCSAARALAPDNGISPDACDVICSEAMKDMLLEQFSLIYYAYGVNKRHNGLGALIEVDTPEEATEARITYCLLKAAQALAGDIKL